jgi:hypothetical protein
VSHTDHHYHLRLLIGTPRPIVFLIDPVSQVIKEKQRIYCDLDGPGLTWLSEILAVGDRIFFINADDRGTWVTVVVEPGPNSVIRRFHLDLPAV